MLNLTPLMTTLLNAREPHDKSLFETIAYSRHPLSCLAAISNYHYLRRKLPTMSDKTPWSHGEVHREGL